MITRLAIISGSLLGVLLALLLLHTTLVNRAVRQAREDFVTKTELVTIQVQRDVMVKRLIAAEESKSKLQTELDRMTEETQAFEKELADYVADLDPDDRCVVDADLYQRLR